MTDIEKNLEIAKNTHRVALNLLVLLDIGLFPGKHTLGLEECKGMIKALSEDAAAKMQQIVPPPAAVPAPAPIPPIMQPDAPAPPAAA